MDAPYTDLTTESSTMEGIYCASLQLDPGHSLAGMTYLFLICTVFITPCFFLLTLKDG